MNTKRSASQKFQIALMNSSDGVKKVALGAVAMLGVVMLVQTLQGGSSGQLQEIHHLRNKLAEYELDADKLIEARAAKAINIELDKARAALALSGTRIYPTTAKLRTDEKKRILVTGGAGFVGSNLVDRLMAQGHEVTVIDNFFTGRRENVEHWIGHPNFRLEQHDVIDPYMAEVDQIYHLACPASPPHYQYNPIKTIKTSTMGTMNMLGLAKRVKARILFTSTSEVYGDPEVHPQMETYWGNVNPIGPRACYDEGKRVAETMCYSYAQEGGVQVRVARIFNTYGPRMHPNDGRVVSNFIIQALTGEPLTVYGEGKQTRSFQFVSDLVNGLMKLMNSNYTQPCNIGNPTETTILEFAKFIRNEIDPDAKITHKPATKDDPSQRKPDITVAGRELGWAPEIDVKDGIATTIKYFKQQLRQTEEKTTIWI